MAKDDFIYSRLGSADYEDKAEEWFAEIDVRLFSKADRESVVAVFRDWHAWRLDMS